MTAARQPRPAMLVEVPDTLPLRPVPFTTDGWHITWSALTGAVLLHRHLPGGWVKRHHLGTATTGEQLATLVRDCAQHLAAVLPCPTGKKRIRSDEAATHALARSLTSPNPHRREQRHYQCEQCGDWHLTSRSTWSAR